MFVGDEDGLAVAVCKNKIIRINKYEDEDAEYEDSDSESEKQYYLTVGDNEEDFGEEFICNEYPIIPLPNKERELLYICGKSGSGKSTVAAEYIRMFNKMFPDRLVILITKEEDQAFNGLKTKRCKLDILTEDPLELENLEDNCLVLFDDVEGMTNKKLYKNVTNLMKEIIESGRKKNIYCIITSHLINDHHRTRSVINELHKVVLFPAGSSAGHIDYFLDKHMGLTKEQIKKIHKTKGRYVLISNTVPQYVLSSKSIYLL